jgi:hypothetical protein
LRGVCAGNFPRCWRLFLSGSENRANTLPNGKGDRRKGGDRRTPAARKTAVGSAGERRSGADRRDESSWQPMSIETSSTASESDVALVAVATDAAQRARRPITHRWRRAETAMASTRLQHRKRDYGSRSVPNAWPSSRRFRTATGLHSHRGRGGHRGANSAVRPLPTVAGGVLRRHRYHSRNLNGPTGRLRLSALLPMPFDRRLLG